MFKFPFTLPWPVPRGRWGGKSRVEALSTSPVRPVMGDLSVPWPFLSEHRVIDRAQTGHRSQPSVLHEAIPAPVSVSSPIKSVKLLIFSNSLPSIFVPLLLSLGTATIPGRSSCPYPVSPPSHTPSPRNTPLSLLNPHSFLTASLDKASWIPQAKLVLPVMPLS